MTYDYELTLINITYSENAMGDSIEIENTVDILCAVESVTQSEHYAAASNGMKPSIVFITNQHEYEKQQLVEFEGDRYRVTRTFKPSDPKYFETIELICEGVI